jgi:Ni,Fe-hydrogenase III small subunit
MKEQEKAQLKKWWKECPNRKIVLAVNAMSTIIAIYCIYALAYGLGKFLAHMGF